jgi:2,3-dihydroxybenzoate decarboxylase
MRYIALEEAFSIPELEARQPAPPDRGRFKPEYEDAWNSKLADFTEFRLPEMDATGIDMQVLSLTVPGLQTDVAAGVAADDHGQFFEQNFAPFPKGVNGIFSLRRRATSRRR